MGLHQTNIIVNKDSSCPHYWLCNYLPLTAGKDTLSRSLIKFKQGRQPDLSGWIDCSLELLEDLIQPGSIIVRALHHDETHAREDRPASLDQLGSALAARFQCHYQPALLRKSHPCRKINGLHKEQREAELKDLYYIVGLSPSIPDPGQSSPSISGITEQPILVIDDILTTATTARAVIAVILTHYPRASLSLFTLAKADYDSDLNRCSPLKGQNYQIEQGMDWLAVQEEDSPYYSNQQNPYYSGQQIRHWIRTDTF